jgi:hypothetical protein
MVKLVCDVTNMRIKIRGGTVWIVPADEPEDNLITRIYPVSSSALCKAMRSAGGSRKSDDKPLAEPPDESPGASSLPEGTPLVDAAKDAGGGAQTDWKLFFRQMGVAWPAGSTIRDLPLVGKLRVTNTPENLAVFERVLAGLTKAPRRVAVDVHIQAFRPADIERLRLSGGGASVAALTALWRDGKSRPVASASVRAEAGSHEVIVKAVREMVYPTELSMDGSQGGRR